MPIKYIDFANLTFPNRRLKTIMIEDAKERERTGETVEQQMARETVEWAAQDGSGRFIEGARQCRLHTR